MEKSRLPLFHKKSKGSNNKSAKQSSGKTTGKPPPSSVSPGIKGVQSNKAADYGSGSNRGAVFSGNKGKTPGNNSNGIVLKNGRKDDNNSKGEKSNPGYNSSKEKLKSCSSVSPFCDELSEKVARKSQQIGHRPDVRESNGIGNVQCANDIKLHSVEYQHANTAIYRPESETLTAQQMQHRNARADGVMDVNSPPLLPPRGPLIPSLSMSNSHQCEQQPNKAYANQNNQAGGNSNNHTSLSSDTVSPYSYNDGNTSNDTQMFNMSSHFQQFRKYYEYDATGHCSKTSTSSDPDSSPHHDYEDIDLIMSRSGFKNMDYIAQSLDVTSHSSQQHEKVAMRLGSPGYQAHHGIKRGPLPPPPPTPPLGSRISPHQHIHHQTVVTSVANSKTYHDFSTSSQNNIHLQKMKTNHGADFIRTNQIPSYNNQGQLIVSRSQSQGQEMGSRILTQGALSRVRHSSSPCSRTGVSTFKQLPRAHSNNDTCINSGTSKGASGLVKSRKDHYQPLLSSSSTLCSEGNNVINRQNSFPSPNSNVSTYSTNMNSHYTRNMPGIKKMGIQSKLVQSDNNKRTERQQSSDSVDGYHSYESVNSDGYHIGVPSDANQTSLGVGLIPTSLPRADNLVLIRKGAGHYGMYSTSTPPDSPLDIVIPPPGGANYFDYPSHGSGSIKKEDPERIRAAEQTLMQYNTNGITNRDPNNYQHTGTYAKPHSELLYNTQQCYSPNYKAHHHSNKIQDLVSVHNKHNQLMDNAEIYDQVADSEPLDSDNYGHQNDTNSKDYSTVILDGKETIVSSSDGMPSYGYIYNMDGQDPKYGVKHLKSFPLPHGGEVICGDVYVEGEEISPVSPPYTPILPISQQASPWALTQGFYSLYSGDYSSSKPPVPQSPHFGRKHSFPSPSCGIRMAELRAKAQRRWSDPKSPSNYSSMVDSYRNTPSPTGSTGSVHSYQSLPIDESMTTIAEEDKSCRQCQATSSLRSSTARKYRSPYQHLLAESHNTKGFQQNDSDEKIASEWQNQDNSTLTNPMNYTVENQGGEKQRNSDVISPQQYKAATTKESFVKHVSNSCSTTCSNNIYNEDSKMQISATDSGDNKGNLPNFHKDKQYQENNATSYDPQQQLQNTIPGTGSVSFSNVATFFNGDDDAKSVLILQHSENDHQQDIRENFNTHIANDSNNRGHYKQVFTPANQSENCCISCEGSLRMIKQLCKCRSNSVNIDQSVFGCDVSQCVRYSTYGSSTAGSHNTLTQTTGNNSYYDNSAGNNSSKNSLCPDQHVKTLTNVIDSRYEDEIDTFVPNETHGNHRITSDINIKKHSDISSVASFDDSHQDELQTKEVKQNRQSFATRQQQKSNQASQTNSSVIATKNLALKNCNVSVKNTSHDFESLSNCGENVVSTLEKGSESTLNCDYNESLPRGDNLSNISFETKAKSENHNISSTTTTNRSGNPRKIGMLGMKGSKLKPPSSLSNRERKNEKAGVKSVLTSPNEKPSGSNAGSLHANPNNGDHNTTSYAKQTSHMGQRESCVKTTLTVNKSLKLSEKTNSKSNKSVSKLKAPSKVIKSKGERLVENRMSPVISKNNSVHKDQLQGEVCTKLCGTSSDKDHKTVIADSKPTNLKPSSNAQIKLLSKSNLAESNTKNELEKTSSEKITMSIPSQSSKSPVKTPDSEKSSVGSERKGRMRSRVGSYSSLSSCDPMSSLPSSRCSSQLSVDSISSDTFEYDLPRLTASNIEEALLVLPVAENLAINSSDTKPIDCINKAVNVHNEVDLRDNVSTCSSNNKSPSDVCKSNNHNNSADVSRDSIDSSAIHTANSDSINSVDSVYKDLETASCASAEELLIGGVELNSNISQHSNSSTTHDKEAIIGSNNTTSKAIMTKSKSLSSSTSSESNISSTSTGAFSDGSSNNKQKQAKAKSQVPTRTVPSGQSKASRLRKPSVHLGQKNGPIDNTSKTCLPQATTAKSNNSSKVSCSNNSPNSAVNNKHSASKTNSSVNAIGNLIGNCKDNRKIALNSSFSRTNSSESNCSSKSTHSSIRGDVSPSSPCEVNNSISNYKANKTTEKTSRLRAPQASKLQKARTLRDINTKEQSGLSKIAKPKQQQKQSTHKNKANDSIPEQQLEKNIHQTTDLKESTINVVCNLTDYKNVTVGDASHVQAPNVDIRQGQKCSRTSGTKITSPNEMRPQSSFKKYEFSEEIVEISCETSQTVITETKSAVVDSPEEEPISNKSVIQKAFKQSSVGTFITKKGKERPVLLSNNTTIAPSSTLAESKVEVVSITSKEKDAIISKDTRNYGIKTTEGNTNNEEIDGELPIIHRDSQQDPTSSTQFGDKDNKVPLNVPTELAGNTGNLHSTMALLSSSQRECLSKVLKTNEEHPCQSVLHSRQEDSNSDTLKSAPSDTINNLAIGSESQIEPIQGSIVNSNKTLIGKDITTNVLEESDQLKELSINSHVENKVNDESHFKKALTMVEKIQNKDCISMSEIDNGIKINECGGSECSETPFEPMSEIRDKINQPSVYKPQTGIHPLLVKPYASLRKNRSTGQGQKSTPTESNYANLIYKKNQGHVNESEIRTDENTSQINVVPLTQRFSEFSHLHMGKKGEKMTREEEFSVDSTNRQFEVNDSVVRPQYNTCSNYCTQEDQLSIHRHIDNNWSHRSLSEQAPASQYAGSVTTDSCTARSSQVALNSTDYNLDTDTNSSQKMPGVRSLETDSETQLFPLETQPTLVRCRQSEDSSARNWLLQPQQIGSINERSGLGSVAIACDTNGVLKEGKTATEEPESTIDCSVKYKGLKSDIKSGVKTNNQSQKCQIDNSKQDNVNMRMVKQCDKLNKRINTTENVIQTSKNIDPKISLDQSSVSGFQTQVVTKISGMENEIQKQELVSSLMQPPKNNCHPAQEGLSNNVKEISMRQKTRCEGVSNACNEDQCKTSHRGYNVAPENISRTGLKDRCDVREGICLENNDSYSQNKMTHNSSPPISPKDNQIYMKVNNKLVNCNKDSRSSVDPEVEIIGNMTEDLSKGDKLPVATITTQLRSPEISFNNSSTLNALDQQVINKCNVSENIDNSQLNAAKLQETNSVIEGDNSALHKPLVVETLPNLIQQAGLSQGLCDSNQHRCMQYDSYFVLNESSRYMTFPAEPFSPKRKKRMALQLGGLQDPFEMKDQYIEDSYFGDPSFISSDTLFCPTVLESPSTRERYSQAIPNGDMLNSLKLSESGYDSWKSQGSSSTACEVDDDPILGVKDNHINLIGQNLNNLSDDSSSSDNESISGTTSSASVITTKTVVSVSEKENGGATSNDEDGKGINSHIKSKATRGNHMKDDYVVRNGGVKVVKSKISAASRSSSESTLTSDAIKYLEWDTSYDNSLLANNKDSSSIEDLLESAELFTKARETSESLERLLQDCDEISLNDRSFESGSLKKRLNFSGSDFALALHSMSKSPSEENVLEESHIPYQQQQGKNTYSGLGIQSSKHSPGLLADDKKSGPQSREHTIDSLEEQSICNIYDPHDDFTKTSGSQEKVYRSIKKNKILVENGNNCKTPAQQQSKEVLEKSEESISSEWPNGGDKYQWKEYSSKSGLIGNQSADQTNPLHCNDSIITDNLVNNTAYESKNTDLSQTSNHQHQQVRYYKHINTPSTSIVHSLQTQPMKCDQVSSAGIQSVYTSSSVSAPGGLINVISGNEVTLTLSGVMSNEQAAKEEHANNESSSGNPPLNHGNLYHPKVNSPDKENSNKNNKNSKSLHKCEKTNDTCTSPVKSKAAFFESGISFLNDRRKQMFQKRTRKSSSQSSDNSNSSPTTPSNITIDTRNNSGQQSPLMGEQLCTITNLESTSNRIKEGLVTSHQTISNEEKSSPSGTHIEAGNQRFTAGFHNYREKVLKSKAHKIQCNIKQRNPNSNSYEETPLNLSSSETMVIMGVTKTENDTNQYEVNCECCLETMCSHNSCASFSTDSYLDARCHHSNDVTTHNASNEPFQESNTPAKRHHSDSDEIKVSNASIGFHNNNNVTCKQRPCSLTLSVRKSSGSQDLAIATMMFLESNNMLNEVFDSEERLIDERNVASSSQSQGCVRQQSHEEYLKSRRNQSKSTHVTCKTPENSFVPNGTLILGSVKNRRGDRNEQKSSHLDDENGVNKSFLKASGEHEQKKSNFKSTTPEGSNIDILPNSNNSSLPVRTYHLQQAEGSEPRFTASQIPWGQKRGSGGKVIEKLKMFQGESQGQDEKKNPESQGHKFGWNFKFRKNKH